MIDCKELVDLLKELPVYSVEKSLNANNCVNIVRTDVSTCYRPWNSLVKGEYVVFYTGDITNIDSLDELEYIQQREISLTEVLEKCNNKFTIKHIHNGKLVSFRDTVKCYYIDPSLIDVFGTYVKTDKLLEYIRSRKKSARK